MRVALDFDGTLVTCYAKQMTLLRAACLAHGVVPDVDRVWQLKRSGHATARALVATGVTPAIAESASRHWQAEVESPYWSQLDSLFADVVASLSGLREQGHALLLLTARRRPHLLQQQVARLGILRYFDRIAVVDPSGASAGKAQVLANWSADVFIGDTESDERAASLANVGFIGVTTGQRTAEHFSVDAVVGSLSAAVAMLVTLPPKTDPCDMRVPQGPGRAQETLDETDTAHP